MTNRTARTVPALVMAASLTAALAGCVFLPPAASGPRVTEDRDIEAVTAIVLETDGDVVVTLGDTPELTITAPEGAMDRLTTRIVDDVLVLGREGPGWGFGDIDYAITLPLVSDIQITGSGDVEADFSGADEVHVSIEGSGDVSGVGVDATAVESSISGSGDIELAGSADDHTLEIDGSGNFDGQDFETRRARVEISGSGDVEVHVTESLDAEVSGSGEIRYTGGAEVTSRVSGSGSVIDDSDD
jgi:hypothetical protein